ncbi:hypothetical protein ASF53_00020 [Methylobacterium sp. Leaf123]|nr:hypothetical protein ASF53_00020 [Methylobacterium sp. Leaf123]
MPTVTLTPSKGLSGMRLLSRAQPNATRAALSHTSLTTPAVRSGVTRVLFQAMASSPVMVAMSRPSKCASIPLNTARQRFTVEAPGLRSKTHASKRDQHVRPETFAVRFGTKSGRFSAWGSGA